MRKLGAIQRKLLILLVGGISLGLAGSLRQRYKTLRAISSEWERINNDVLREAIDSLYRNKMVDLKENPDGSVKIILLDKGKQRVLDYKLENIQIKKLARWDKLWRMVLFDIPTSKKKVREALRFHLKRLGFYQYQKSVFIHPHECKNEIDFLVEFYGVRKYVRQLIVQDLDNQLYLKEIFKKLF
ncbi:MAG: CRISPR-associated endonuclease Cas2 [Candidatus Harrisonbacteria bacterium]|nr:CRISPR-associated endonuclease Cas2 [Candidatus Harrisonbacteria bacterium]